jgi:hypothetical protein
MAHSGDSDEPYKVGKGKPPRHTQFKPGQSGNRRGRSRGSRNLATILHRELQTRVTVTIDGRRKQLTKQELVIKQLVNKAVAGDPKVIPTLLDEIRLIETIVDSSVSRSATSKEDLAIIKNIVKRIRSSST